MMAASPMRAAGPETVVRVDPRTGKLVRSAAPPAARRPVSPATRPVSKDKAALAPIIQKAAENHKVDPLLVESVIQVESNYNPHAVSSKGAEGAMQLMPSTARMLGVTNSFDPRQNIEAGVRYLKYLQELYKDDQLALAAYNAGPAAVDKYKWVPPFRETRNYVNQVNTQYQSAYQSAAAAAKPAEKPAPAGAEVKGVKSNLGTADLPAEERHPKLEQFVDRDGRLHLRTAQ